MRNNLEYSWNFIILKANKKQKIMKAIYEINYSIIDYGVEWEAKPIETNSKNHKQAVKNHLKKWGYAMDLSSKHQFKIKKVSLVGYGTV
tara:strand:- start:9 stop:275 length:267 start_codon:yes stop_codon:yes gene_type:complete